MIVRLYDQHGHGEQEALPKDTKDTQNGTETISFVALN
jgi:hypothetical protein